MRHIRATLFSIVMACITFPVFAQSDVIKPGEERFTLGLGAVLNSFGTNVRVDNPILGRGSDVNMRDDLGADQDASSYWASGEWRIASRHRIGFAYSRFKLSGTRTMSREITIGDERYPAGAAVSSELKLQIVPITYSYSFIKTESDELAATFGVHWSRLSFKAQGSATLGTSSGAFDSSNDTSAKGDLPLPLVGLRYDHHFSQQWSVGLQGAYFKLKSGEDTLHVEGETLSARTYVEYRFSRNYGFGLAIEGYQVDVEASKGSWQGGIDYRYWGPQLYLKARF